MQLGAYCAGKRSLLQTLGIGPIKTDVVTIGGNSIILYIVAVYLVC